MASYQQGPNLASYNFKPYELPYNGIMKQIQAKTEYWNEGAQRLKDSYQNSAGLELSLDGNRQALKGFMDTANEQISKAAKSDLSNPDNVQSALNIFKPLYSGDTQLSQNIMGDHAITTKARDINSKYDQLRTQNGGKGYSDINKQYSLDAYNEFLKSDDPSSWKKNYQNMKDVIPYHDYKPELEKAIAGCKSVTKNEGVDGSYLISREESHIDRGCLGASLSPNAERQMQIEGYVKYGKNYQALRDAYVPTLIASREQTAKERASLAANLLNTKLTPEQKTAISQQMTAYDDVLSNQDKSIEKLHNNDLSDIVNNYEQIAGSTLKGQKLNAISSVFSRKDDRKADPVKLQADRILNENNMMYTKFRFDAAKQDDQQDFLRGMQDEKLAAQGKKRNSKGEIVDDISSYTPIAAPDAIEKTYNDHTSEVKGTQDALVLNDKYLSDFIKNDPRYQNLIKSGTNSPEFKQLINSLVADPNNRPIEVQEYIAKRSSLANKLANLKIQEQVIDNLPEVKQARDLVGTVANSITTGMTIKDPTGGFINLQPQQIKDLITNGETNGAKLVWRNSSFQGNYGSVVPTDSKSNLTGGIREQVLQINGKQIPVGETGLAPLLTKAGQKAEDYAKVRDSKYKEAYASQFPYLDLSPRNSEEKGNIDPLRRKLGSVLAGVANINPNDAAKAITLIGSRYDGSAVISISSAKDQDQSHKPYDEKLLMQSFGQHGYTIQPIANTPNTYLVKGITDLDRSTDIDDLQATQNFAENLIKLKQQGGLAYARVDMNPVGGYKIAAKNNISGGLRFEITDKNGKVQNAENPTELKSWLEQLQAADKLKAQQRP